MKNLQLATIPATDACLVQASNIDQEFLISVALPYHYNDNTDKTYPVIYILDGNWYFGMVVDMVRVMNIRVPFCNELPDAIIVAIGYPYCESLEETQLQILHRRVRDFTPTRDVDSENWMRSTFPTDDPVPSGGGDNFLEFIKNELIPLIESKYRADTKSRILLGHSLGGFFALHTAFKYPNLFNKYVVVSPALNPVREQYLSDINTNLPVRIFLAAGSSELASEGDHAQFRRIAQLLEKRLSEEFKLTECIFPNLTHCAVVAPAFQAGLVSVMS